MFNQNMKTKIGNRLHRAREERKLNQVDMAELLGVSSATYSRMERSETSVELEQIVQFANLLGIPPQEFLPHNMTVNGYNHSQKGQVGVVIGNVYHNLNETDIVKELQHEIELKDKEIQFMSEKIKLLENQIEILNQLVNTNNP